MLALATDRRTSSLRHYLILSKILVFAIANINSFTTTLRIEFLIRKIIVTPRTSHHRASLTRRCWLRKYNSKFNYLLLSLSRTPARHGQEKLSNRSQVKLGYLCNKLISHEKICIGCILSQSFPAILSLGTVGRMTRMTSHRWFRLADFNHLSPLYSRRVHYRRSRLFVEKRIITLDSWFFLWDYTEPSPKQRLYHPILMTPI